MPRAWAGFLAVAALKLLGLFPPRVLVFLGTPWIPFYILLRKSTRRRLKGLKSRVAFPIPSPLTYYRMRLRIAALSLRHLTGHYNDCLIRMEGEEFYRVACAAGRPVALVGWHQGPVELLHRLPPPLEDGGPFWIATAGGFAAKLSGLLKQGRKQEGKEIADPESLPAALRAWARRRGVLAVMLDQVPGRPKEWLSLWNGAVEIPFPRNLWDWMKSRDALFIGVSARLEKDGSILLSDERLPPEIEDLQRMMETKLADAADQYNWSYPKIRMAEKAGN